MRSITYKAVKIVACILSWFALSSSLSIINKYLFGATYNDFKFPLLVSSIHTSFHFILAYVIIHFLFKSYFYQQDEAGGLNFKIIGYKDNEYWYKVVPCGVAGGIEISASNAALMFVSLSFYTVVKSSVPIWVLIFSFLFQLEAVRIKLILMILVICFGVVLSSIGEAKFDGLGFILILSGAISSGLKWCLTQILLQKQELNIDHPILTLYVIAPIMAVSMFISSLIFEDVPNAFHAIISITAEQSKTQICSSILLVVLGGVTAFFMTLAEFFLIQLTSTLTMSVAGITKEVLVIGLSVLIFRDKLTALNYLGLFISITGIAWYNYYKIVEKPKEVAYSSMDSPMIEDDQEAIFQSPVLPALDSPK